MKIFRIPALAVLACLALPAQAQDAPLSPAEILAQGLSAPAPEYSDELTHGLDAWSDAERLRLASGPRLLAEDFETGVAPPAANAAPETRREIIDLMIHAMGRRSSRNSVMAAVENGSDGPGLFLLHGLIAGPENNPALWKMLRIVDDEVTWFTLREKARHGRPRPWELDSALEPELTATTSSYPALLPARAWAAADILARLNPVCESWYESVARNTSELRQVAGTNYASDTRASKILAQRVVKRIIDEGHLAGIAQEIRAEMLSARNPFTPCVLLDR